MDLDLGVCPGSFRLFLYKLRVGRDAAVARNLSSAWNGLLGDPEESDSPEVVILHTIGEWDLAVLARGRGAQKSLRAHGTIANILGSVEIVCDEVARGQKSRLDHFRFDCIVSITMVRLYSIDATAEDSASAERRFLEWWAEEHADDHDVLLLTTLGGPQFIIVRRNTQHLGGFDQWMMSLCQSIENLRSTYTLLAIDDRRVQDDQPDRSRFGTIPTGCELQLRIAGDAGNASANQQLADELFGEAGFRVSKFQHTGAEDFTVGLQPQGANRHFQPLVEALFGFRERADGVYSTACAVLFRCSPPAADAVAVSAGRRLRPPISLSSQDARKIDELHEVGKRTLRFLYQFSNLIDDATVFDEVPDMVLCWYGVRAAAVEPSRHIDREERLNSMINGVEKGILQRLSWHLGPAPSAISGLPPATGSINRVLQAASSLPIEITNRLVGKADRNKWRGLITVGPMSGYFADRESRIFLPAEEQFRPNRWVALIHESMHCFFRDNPSVVGSRLTELGDDLPYVGKIHEELLVDYWDLAFAPGRKLWMDHFESKVNGSINEAVEPKRLRQAVIRSLAIEAVARMEEDPAGGLDLAAAVDVLEQRYKQAPQMGFRDKWIAAIALVRRIPLGSGSKQSEFLTEMVDALPRPLSMDERARREEQFDALDLDKLLTPSRLFDDPEVTDPTIFVWKLWQQWPERVPVPERAVALSVLLHMFRRLVTARIQEEESRTNEYERPAQINKGGMGRG